MNHGFSTFSNAVVSTSVKPKLAISVFIKLGVHRLGMHILAYQTYHYFWTI